MRLWSDSFADGAVIAPRCAFGVMDPVQHVALSANRNPHLGWDDVPAGTQSLALFCIDIDAPSDGADVNQPGRAVPESMQRTEFFHWSLIDIPPALKSISEGMFSDMVTPHGKPGPEVAFPVKNGTEHKLRQGTNDYTAWFASDPDMAGEYYGYDGPCPPWNDLRVHRYLFRLYALDVPQLPIDGSFSGADARLAIRGHILDEAQLLGIYSLHPEVAKTLDDE